MGQPKDTRSDAIPGKDRYDDEARAARATWWEEASGADVSPLHTALPAESMRGHVENFVGAVTVPIGLAGPLRFLGESTVGTLCAPMATTEGALVAAICRGARALSHAGGVTSRMLARRMVRAPLFGFRDGGAAARFVEWAHGQRAALGEVAHAGSVHTTLINVTPYTLGRDVHLVLDFDTGDAAGQNMVTLATARICAFVQERLPAMGLTLDVCTVEGQMSGDKNLSFFNASHGRGARVVAECFVPRETLESVLRISPETLSRAHHAGMAGALQSGVAGYNANVANVVAALFVATGQDIACVHESSFGILTLDAHRDGAYASLLLPSLVVGTVGGGTVLPAQQACLRAMGCAGTGKVRRLAEIVTGFALALELSSYAAMVTGQFASAHATLGRKSGPPPNL